MTTVGEWCEGVGVCVRMKKNSFFPEKNFPNILGGKKWSSKKFYSGDKNVLFKYYVKHADSSHRSLWCHFRTTDADNKAVKKEGKVSARRRGGPGLRHECSYETNSWRKGWQLRNIHHDRSSRLPSTLPVHRRLYTLRALQLQ